MDDPLVMVITRAAADELDLLLELMDRAAADPDGQPITMEVLFGAGFTRQGLGVAHDAVRQVLAGEQAPPPRPDPTPEPAVEVTQPPMAGSFDPAMTFEELPESEKHTALLDEVITVLTSVRTLLVALVAVAVVATLLAAVAVVR
jgi:hypothetical protein